jgi:hypothetical protein
LKATISFSRWPTHANDTARRGAEAISTFAKRPVLKSCGIGGLHEEEAVRVREIFQWYLRRKNLTPEQRKKLDVVRGNLGQRLSCATCRQRVMAVLHRTRLHSF